MSKKAKKLFNENVEKAKSYLEDKEKLSELLRQVEEVVAKVPYVGQYTEYVPSMLSLVNDYAHGVYNNTSVLPISFIIAGFIYLVSPINKVTDLVPVLGKVDDVVILQVVLTMSYDEIEKYNKWRIEKGIISKNAIPAKPKDTLGFIMSRRKSKAK